MTPELYWETSDPKLFWAYRAKYMDEAEFVRDQGNFQAWLSGLYFRSGVIDAIDLAFGGEGKTYPESPIDFQAMKEEIIRLASMTEEEKLMEKQQKIEQENDIQMQKVMEMLNGKTGE